MKISGENIFSENVVGLRSEKLQKKISAYVKADVI